jgi:hypothetical protein
MIIKELASRGTAELERFFIARGLGRAFAAPSKGWGRQKRVNEAVLAAERRGDVEDVLRSAAAAFEIPLGEAAADELIWLRVSADSAETDLDVAAERGRELARRASHVKSSEGVDRIR